jgi:hypothetical protein
VGLKVTMNVPTYLQGSPPPPLDTPWLARASTPLGTTALGATVTCDPSLVRQLVDAGWTVNAWTTG